MEDYTKLCMNCFKDLRGNSVCPHCGYEQDHTTDPDHLPGGTLIADRFVIGRVRGQDDTGIVYNVFDLNKNTRRRMREFFPASIAIREFVRFEMGEGLQKREDDLAAEVAKLTGKA